MTQPNTRGEYATKFCGASYKHDDSVKIAVFTTSKTCKKGA